MGGLNESGKESMHQSGLNGERLLSEKQVAEMLGVHHNTVKRLYESSKFPKPIWVGSRKRWQLSVVRAWIDLHQADADRNPGPTAI